MKLQEFKIGERFFLHHKEYLCTDVGTRTVACIFTSAVNIQQDLSWLRGPPYAVQEVVFDEHDIDVCTKEPKL